MPKEYVLPPQIFNRRIRESINQFFDDLVVYCKKQQITLDVPKRRGDSWTSRDFKIFVSDYFPDGAIKEIYYELKNLPGIVKAETNLEKCELSYNHIFTIKLNRAYPADLDKVKIISKTPLYHPRFEYRVAAPICVIVNSEVKRILDEIIHQILMDPVRVHPPHSDMGLNSKATVWFMKSPQKIHKFLLRKWYEKHKQLSKRYRKDSEQRSKENEKKSKVIFLD